MERGLDADVLNASVLNMTVCFTVLNSETEGYGRDAPPAPPEDHILRNAILLDSDNVLMTEDGVPVVYN